MYLFDMIENKAYDLASEVLDIYLKHKDAKEAKKKSVDQKTKERAEYINNAAKKLNMEEVPYSENFKIFQKALENKVPAIRAHFNPSADQPHNYTTHFRDNDGTFQELHHSTGKAINFVERAMEMSDKASKVDLDTKTGIIKIRTDDHYIKNIELYDYKLLNDDSVLFIKIR